jgi:hypothetical protein
MLVSKNSDVSAVTSSEYILKLMINKGRVGESKFIDFLNLIWETKCDIRAAYLKAMDPFRMSYTYIGLTL